MKIKTKTELDTLNSIVAELAALKFYPSEPAAMVAIVSDVANMVHTMDDARWLVKRMRQLFNEWPGPMELRAVYCYDHFPDDGVRAYSQIYQNGFPGGEQTEDWRRQLTGPSPKREPWTDEELAEAQSHLDAARERRKRERPTMPTPAVDAEQFNRLLSQIDPERKPITAEDFARLKESKAQ